MSRQSPVVDLTPDDCAELAGALGDAADHRESVRLMVDDGGVKYSASQRVWSFPPIGKVDDDSLT